MKGYKVFNQDWTCRGKQYNCPGNFEEEGKLEVCEHGMHFCENAADCFNYYDFDSNNKVAEVIAYGTVLKEGDKSCTDKLEIVREIPWDEVLRIVNTGKNCTGRCNTGDCNTGDYNTGDYNTGDYNTGDYNTGDCNTGDYNTGDRNTGDWNTGNRNTGYRNTGNRNTGDWNTGDWNTGDWNTGDWNTGNRNTGYRNTGNRNTGDWNTGDYNTGDRNTGYRNTGDWNTGNRNTGDCNKSSFNTGCFMTEEQNIMLFNKPSDWTYRDWLHSDARYMLKKIKKDVVEWIYSEDMTDEEKEQNPEYKTTGGYLKVLDESECGQIWWDNLTEKEKKVIKDIPNFDKDIFEEITGIKIK
ncbi:pentapeptide repeat-containing protein [Velocimicrobium porci]|uniref:DUF7666 domain-containing protein n=1 Tax=Velocimicrobium porci TaxID=2606634 RepID=A0A6L5XXG4_9FIRM|nr:pentapeptide repeat-containing protein [Velocimicrobium porci]MSS63161.1 hypothetical protein [Velocimicrobium porci]